MAVARSSPTANLLRHSRLFAVPAPVPSPLHAASSQTVAESDTATRPHPTHAAIETSTSSLARGDWGLKRPLPLKSTTKTSNPVIRIKGGIDTREHIVDFESAADHTLTLRKWQELHLPVQIPQSRSWTISRREPARSAFQSTFDNIKDTRTPDNKKWKFEGPWLAGQSGLEFEDYIKKQIRHRKPEFMGKLRADLALKKRTEMRRKAMEAGEDLDDSVESMSVSDAELRDHVRHLRGNPQEFGPLIHEFLDLPNGPDRPINDPGWSSRVSYLARPSRASSTRYSLEGVPSTHPSAGLSYLHHSAYVYNHPLFGPQSNPRAVEARVLQSKAKRRSEVFRAALGVAGFVALDSSSHSFRSESERGTGISDFVIKPGGSKILVSPKRASVDSEGRVHIELNKATFSQQGMYGKPVKRKPSEPLPDVVSGFGGQLPHLDGRYQSSKARPNDESREFDPSRLKSSEDVKRSLNAEFGADIFRS